MTDCGDDLGYEIPLLATAAVPNAVALAGAARAKLILRWVHIKATNFFC